MGSFSSGVGKIAGAVTGVMGGSMGGETESAEATANNGITIGDYVALLPIVGGQKFIVLGKLVYGEDLASMMEAAAESSGGGMDIGTASSIAGAFE